MSIVGGSASTRGKATAIGSTSDFRPSHGFHLLHSRLAKIGLSATGKAFGPSGCQACGTGRVIDQKAIGLISSIEGIDPSVGAGLVCPCKPWPKRPLHKWSAAVGSPPISPPIRPMSDSLLAPRAAPDSPRQGPPACPNVSPYNVFK